MQVAHQVVLVARAAVLALVDVADEPFLDVIDAFAQRGGKQRENDKGGKDEQYCGYHRSGTLVNTIQNNGDKYGGQYQIDDEQDHNGNIGYRSTLLPQLIIFRSLD